jgi:hypothetical protein
LKTGTITDTDDKAIKDGFETALREQVASYLVTPTNTSSVLTNDLLFEDTFDKDGKLITHKAVNYSFTYDKAEAAADPYKILLTVQGGGSGVPTPDFTTANGEKQRQAALEYLTRQTIEKIDVKVGKQVIAALGDAPRPSDWSLANAEEKKKLLAKGRSAGEQLAYLLTSANPSLVQNAGGSLSQLYTEISAIDKTGKNTNITFRNKANEFVGADLTPYNYAKAVLNSLGLTPDEQREALIEFKKYANSTLNEISAKGVTVVPPADEGVIPNTSVYNK